MDSGLVYSLLQDQELIFESEADWETKFSVLFNNFSKKIKPLLKENGLKLEWCLPFYSYEEDVRAYMAALLRLKQNLEKLPARVRP